MSRKRKIEQLGEHIVSAAVGDVVSRTISSAVGKLEEHADVESQVERLDSLVTMVRSAVEAAEGVHIRNMSLRRWLWKLREAACEGADAVRSFRQRAAEETDRDNAGSGTWWARLLRSTKSFFQLFQDGGMATFRSAVARLELAVSGLGEFLKLLDMETRSVSLMAPLTFSTMPAVVLAGNTRSVFLKIFFLVIFLGPHVVILGISSVLDVILLTVGTCVIWFAFQVGSKML